MKAAWTFEMFEMFENWLRWAESRLAQGTSTEYEPAFGDRPITAAVGYRPSRCDACHGQKNTNGRRNIRPRFKVYLCKSAVIDQGSR